MNMQCVVDVIKYACSYRYSYMYVYAMSMGRVHLIVQLCYVYKHENVCPPHWSVHSHVHNVCTCVEFDKYIVCDMHMSMWSMSACV